MPRRNAAAKCWAALATGLGGCGLAELLRLGSEEGSNELAEHQTAFARLRREWRPETFIVMFSGLLKYFDIPARFARQEGGERKLANLHQLGDLLQQESSRRKLSINALLNFLSDAVEGRIDDSSDEVKQILESDRDSVKITTVHSSKGLEYPVVILPSLSTLRPEAVRREAISTRTGIWSMNCTPQVR